MLGVVYYGLLAQLRFLLGGLRRRKKPESRGKPRCNGKKSDRRGIRQGRRGQKPAHLDACGVLDADITGPSIPKLFGVHDKLEGCEEGILPARSEGGVQMVSINLVLPNEDDPVIYRGPIIAETVKQFWSDVIWQDVDYMFVDMPPGTGDVPLTVFQSIPVDGIVVMTSPQDLVSMIVGKAVKMAKMMNIPILGIVENYSYLACPDCGKKIELFGKSKVDEVAAEYELPVLAKLPLDPKLAEAVDRGEIEDVKLPDELHGAMKALEALHS